MLNEIRKEFGLQPLPFPKCLFADKEKKVIVMENLKHEGFQMKKLEGTLICKFVNKLDSQLDVISELILSFGLRDQTDQIEQVPTNL
jgi:hypothetical protein